MFLNWIAPDEEFYLSVFLTIKILKQELLLKKIYDEVKESMFDISNMIN